MRGICKYFSQPLTLVKHGNFSLSDMVVVMVMMMVIKIDDKINEF